MLKRKIAGLAEAAYGSREMTVRGIIAVLQNQKHADSNTSRKGGVVFKGHCPPKLPTWNKEPRVETGAGNTVRCSVERGHKQLA